LDFNKVSFIKIIGYAFKVHTFIVEKIKGITLYTFKMGQFKIFQLWQLWSQKLRFCLHLEFSFKKI